MTPQSTVAILVLNSFCYFSTSVTKRVVFVIVIVAIMNNEMKSDDLKTTWRMQSIDWITDKLNLLNIKPTEKLIACNTFISIHLKWWRREENRRINWETKYVIVDSMVFSWCTDWLESGTNIMTESDCFLRGYFS